METGVAANKHYEAFDRISGNRQVDMFLECKSNDQGNFVDQNLEPVKY